MSEIRFRNVAKHYSGFEAIDDLNLVVEPGEFMVLVGPSGCSKSTTLRMIAGLETITSGDLLIAGERANDLSPRDRNISMVFQSYALFPNMTVRENLSFGMQIRKENKTNIRKEVDRVAEMLGLQALLDRKPKQLSGGQAQRVALGRAMIRKPQAFLFDEPLSNLDAELRVQMRAEISQMQHELNVTTVYVTHDQTEAMTMGDRVAVMNEGKIMQVGTPIDLYSRPANKFVAGFIGSPKMNFSAVSGGSVLGADLPDSILPRESASVGVRPEHVTIAREGDIDNHLMADARVAHLEHLGHETLVHVTQNGESKMTIRAEAESVLDLKTDSNVRIALPYERMFFFDETSGDNLR